MRNGAKQIQMGETVIRMQTTDLCIRAGWALTSLLGSLEVQALDRAVGSTSSQLTGDEVEWSS